MADVKRHFYNTGDAKGFTRKDFFTVVKSMLEGNTVDPEATALALGACNYELESIELRAAASASTGEKKDPLQSNYANEIRKNILPFIDGTPRTAKELVDIATSKGKVASTGKGFSAPWVSRVLNAEAGIVCVKKIVDKVDAKGLKCQAEVTAYKRG